MDEDLPTNVFPRQHYWFPTAPAPLLKRLVCWPSLQLVAGCWDRFGIKSSGEIVQCHGTRTLNCSKTSCKPGNETKHKLAPKMAVYRRQNRPVLMSLRETAWLLKSCRNLSLTALHKICTVIKGLIDATSSITLLWHCPRINSVATQF